MFTERISDLIADGRLSVGQRLHFSYRGRSYEAVVEEVGLRFGGHVFDNPSPAALLITEGVQVNGWKHWRTSDGRDIGSLRRF